ncbi:periplasmic heavy metal sensor [Desulfobotulus sp. H1]|uniref:Periplasmic heavy metal sensor n=1 Tax=Desulfobotulus pelophilus TaxID=2823377 RepID=A0ABT3N7V8_9BACT|nr:hypothetical protein [Desulfobotulus pelophilus]MCW7753122.1 periplasmic heavy metal sensor [Desulfobotulus pelophilus]
MKKLIVGILGAGLIGLVAVQSFAWHGGGSMRGKGMGTCMDMSPEDRASFMKETTELRVAMETNRAELAAVMAEEHPNQARVEALFQEMARHKAAMALKARERGLTGMGEGCPCTGMRHSRKGGASMQ